VALLWVLIHPYPAGIYAPVLGQSKEIDYLFKQLHQKINIEIGFQKLLFGMQGVFDMIFAQNSNAFAGIASEVPNQTPANSTKTSDSMVVE